MEPCGDNGTFAPSDIESLVGPPPLLRIEKRSDYDVLLAGYVEAWQPEGLIEWIWVRDIADCEFAARRYERIRDEAGVRMIITDLTELDVPRHAVELRAFACTWIANPAERHGLATKLVAGLRDSQLDLFATFKAKWISLDDLKVCCEAARARRDRALHELTAHRDRRRLRAQSDNAPRNEAISPNPWER